MTSFELNEHQEAQPVHPIRRIFASGLVAASLLSALLSPALAVPQLLLDMRTGEVLYENEAGVPWHPASLTKLMTALLAFEAIERGEATLSTPVITSANALAVPPSKMGFPVGTAISLEDALYILVIKSANDIAVAIAETLADSETDFVALMNRRAAELGLTGTHFVNPHGLHDPAQITTARDMAIIALTIRARYPQYDPMFGTYWVEHGQTRSETNNVLLTRFAGTDGMKTGFVCASGLNIVATAARNGRNLMAITMGAATARERSEMTAQMLTSGFSGGYRGLGRSIVELTNAAGLAPRDMRPQVCGSEAAAYTAEREAEFPAGLTGEISYLGERFTMPSHTIAVLGRLREVPLPRPRPAWLPVVAAVPAPAESMGVGDSSVTVIDIPLPIPRPQGL